MNQRGRIVLDKFIPTFPKALKDNIIREAAECSHNAYWLNIENQSYLFKTCDSTTEIMKSLLVEKIAVNSGIETVKTRYSSLGYSIGELILDYRQNGYRYINGAQILKEYYEYLKSINQLEVLRIPDIENLTETAILNKMNHLESIWNALEFHYRKLDPVLCAANVERIMRKHAQRFCLDFLTMQSDRYNENWEIAENIITEEADLTPLYDSSKSFDLLNFYLKMGITSVPKHNTYRVLEELMDSSDNYTKNYFEQLYQENPPEKIVLYLNELSNENGLKLLAEETQEILASYTKNYEIIAEMLQKEKRR